MLWPIGDWRLATGDGRRGDWRQARADCGETGLRSDSIFGSWIASLRVVC